MFKALCVICVLALFMPGAYASDQREIFTYQVKNENVTNYQMFNIPTTSIRPNVDKVLGWSIQPLGNEYSSENVISIWDCVTSYISGENMAENEASDNTGLIDWFPYPRTVTTGVSVWQGPNTQVVIYFTNE